MSRNSKLISENLREEIAKELGVYDQVKQDGGSWASVPSRDCGNIVTKAIEIAKNGGLFVKEYSLEKNKASELGMACGGSVKVMIEGIE